jgi:hypothetical protein
MRYLTFALVVALLAGSSTAQSTRPSGDLPPQWERLVSSLTAALVAHDGDSVQSTLGTSCRVARFFAEPDADAANFVDAVSPDIVLGDHAYVQPATSLAADVAHDVNNSPIVSDFAKKTLNLSSASDESKRARATVGQWTIETLAAADGDLVGVIVLWDARPDTEDQHRLNFILVKGEQDSTTGECHFVRVAYGDPLQ